MNDDDDIIMFDADRLELAALTAPIMRREDDAAMKAKRRRVYVVKRDDPTWTPIAEASGADALKGLVKIQEIEHTVVEVRPKTIICEFCRKPVKVSKKGIIPKSCQMVGGCHRQKKCATRGCNRMPSGNAFSCQRVKQRNGTKWYCRPCTMRNVAAAKTPEERSDRARKANASMTPEQRSENARKAGMASAARWAAKTPEERSDRARKANASMTPEQRSENARKAGAANAARWAAMTPEERGESRSPLLSDADKKR